MVRRRTPPRSFAELRTKVLERYDALSVRQRQFARYLLDEPNDVALERISVLSRRSRVAPAAIVRFAQRFGFQGASQMRRLFRNELLAAGPEAAYVGRARRVISGEGKSASTHRESLAGLAEASRLALTNLTRTIGRAELVAAVDLLKQAATVQVVGARSAFPIAAYLAYCLQEAGKRSILNGSMAGPWQRQVENLTAEDLLVAISYRPYEEETLQAVVSARANGASVLSLTDSAASPIAKSADGVLRVREAEVSGLRSLSASLCLAHAVVVEFAFESRRYA